MRRCGVAFAATWFLLFVLTTMFCVSGVEGSQHATIEEYEYSSSSRSTTHVSYGERLKDAFWGVLIGVLLFICAFPLLTYAEGKFVYRCKLLDALLKELGMKYDRVTGKRLAAGSGGGSHETDALLQDKAEAGSGVFFASGPVRGGAVGAPGLCDDLFLVSNSSKAQGEGEGEKKRQQEFVVKDAMKLQRAVEMYQWHEIKETKTEKDSFGGGETRQTTYRHEKRWSSEPQTCPQLFLQQSNPPFPFTQHTFVPEHGFTLQPSNDPSLAPVSLSSSQAARIECDQPHNLQQHQALLDDVIAHRKAGLFQAFAAHELVENGDCLYLYRNKNKGLNVGDMRVRWTYAREGTEYSVLTHPDMKTLVGGVYKLPYLCCGCCPGPVGLFVNTLDSMGESASDIDLMKKGVVGPQAMVASAKQTAAWWRMGANLIGFLMLWLGLYLVVHPIAVLLDVVGFIGSIVDFGLTFASLIVAIVLYCVTVAFAWGLYHPLKAGLYLLCAGLLLYGAHWYTQGDNADAIAAAQHHKLL